MLAAEKGLSPENNPQSRVGPQIFVGQAVGEEEPETREGSTRDVSREGRRPLRVLPPPPRTLPRGRHHQSRDLLDKKNLYSNPLIPELKSNASIEIYISII